MTELAILYQNAAQTITLIDIPTSISQAQGNEECPCPDNIFSSPALRSAYPSLEPKSEKAKANVLRMKGASEDEFPRDLLFEAIKVIQNHWKADWCLERRTLSPQVIETSKKRRKDDPSIEALPLKSPDIVVAQGERRTSHAWEPLNIASDGLTCSHPAQLIDRAVHNPTSRLQHLWLPEKASYRIPPACTFLLSNIRHSTAMSFSMAALRRFPFQSETTPAGPGQFDFLLLDPPWANRSARRAKEYQIPELEEDPMDVLASMLGQHVAPRGLVGCWITNKASVREEAMSFFRHIGVDLIEEWAWLKVTIDGVPMTEIDGLWRKPYEVLLIGRQTSSGPEQRDWMEEAPSRIRRRVIVAVPDLHSRKPSLKELVKPMISGCQPHRVVEIFARNLTAGWWSWGDEALKYNWTGFWSTGEVRTDGEVQDRSSQT